MVVYEILIAFRRPHHTIAQLRIPPATIHYSPPHSSSDPAGSRFCRATKSEATEQQQELSVVVDRMTNRSVHCAPRPPPFNVRNMSACCCCYCCRAAAEKHHLKSISDYLAG
jgi:hypothetical protein